MHILTYLIVGLFTALSLGALFVLGYFIISTLARAVDRMDGLDRTTQPTAREGGVRSGKELSCRIRGVPVDF